MPSKPPAFLSTVPCTYQVHVVDELGFDAAYGRMRRRPPIGRTVTTRGVGKNVEPTGFVAICRVRQSEGVGRTSRRTRSVMTAKPFAGQEVATVALVTQHHQTPPQIELYETLGFAGHVDLVRREPLDEGLDRPRGMPREPQEIMMRERYAHDSAAVRAGATATTDSGAVGSQAIEGTL
jgi:hypothetical protein